MILLQSLGTAVLLFAAELATAQGPMSSTPTPAAASGPATASSDAPGEAGAFDVEKLFANTCGWCHSDAGRVAGRGPKLMDSPLTDAEMAYRIKKGKQGAMPAFESAFSEEQIKAIIQYTRDLKPLDTPPK